MSLELSFFPTGKVQILHALLLAAPSGRDKLKGETGRRRRRKRREKIVRAKRNGLNIVINGIFC